MAKSLHHNWYQSSQSERQFKTGGRISSDLADLTAISARYPWIPSGLHVRPPSEVKERKRKEIEALLNKWASLKEFILCNVFEMQVDETSKPLRSKDTMKITLLPEWMFKPCTFKYELPAYSNHYVLWNTRYDIFASFPDGQINMELKDQIQTVLDKMNDASAFDFAWYKNPKPTVNEFWHVQVFWVSLS